MLYENIDEVLVKRYKQQINFVIVTATPIETAQLHKLIKPFPEQSKLLRFSKNDYTYTLGNLGKYAIAHVQCEMGSVGVKSSMATCSVSHKIWNPKAFIMVGIAFGVNKRKQKIGDILISSSVIPYEKERVGKKNRITRARPLNSGKILLDRVSNNQYCNFLIADKDGLSKRTPKVKIGEILSGEKLIDNTDFKANLLVTQPEAIGGEMEGAGLASFSNSHSIEWILIKGICDYADGKKSVNKDEYQKIAARSAAKYLMQLFSYDNLFEDLGLKKITKAKKLNPSNKESIEDVLFEIYSKENKSNYIIRKVDQDIVSKAEHYSIWISGGTGIGKTTAAFKYSLDQKNIEFMAIGLANSLTNTPLGMFTEFYNQLCLKFSLEIPNKKFNSLTDAYNKIFSLILDKIGAKKCIILIDEIPITGKTAKIFVDVVYSLVLHIKTYFKSLNFKLIISTFFEPTCHLSIAQQKIKDQLKFYHMQKWTNKDIQKLVKLISNKLLLAPSSSEYELLLDKANGSPRFIKKVFRDYIRNKDDQQYTLTRVIEESALELNYE